MARPRSNSPQRKGRGTSFGKKSEAEKTFRKRKVGSRSGRFDAKPGSSPYGTTSRDENPKVFRSKPSGFRRNDEGPRNAPFRRGKGESYGADKPDFRKQGNKSFGPQPNRDDSRDKKAFGKREESSFRSRSGGPAKFARPYRSDGDQEKKPYRKTDSPSFGPRADRGEFKKPSRKTEGFSKPPRAERGEAGPDQDRKKKPFQQKERKSFVQSRVVTSADFTKPARKEETPKDDGLTRLNKYIANSGVGSRREADELIKMGLVSVNGTTVTTLGTKVKPGDVVRYEDRVLKAEKPVYILLNKPKGFITTTEDPQERSTVMGLVAGACKERIYPVGRLDRNTTGLLLLTNDGDLADKLTHPSYKAKKVYKVELDRPLTKNDFKKIMEGVHLEEGRAMVDDVAIISEDDKTVGLEIHIGWNRVVRRIFETLGYDVVKLDRSVFAGLDKKDLSRGQWRFLKPEEVVRLKHFK